MPFSGPDSIAVFHTNGSTEAYPGAYPGDSEQPYASRSTGNHGSTTRARWLGVRLPTGGILGVRILFASGTCGVGEGTLVAVDTDTLAFAAPGEAIGAAVAIASGETKRVGSESAEKYLIVERVAADNLAGNATVELIETVNEALCGDSFEAAESSATQVVATVTNETPPTVWLFATDITADDYAYTGHLVVVLTGNQAGEVRRADTNWNRRIYLADEKIDPPLAVGDTVAIVQHSGRCHALFVHNKSSLPVTDLSIWLPALGTQQTIEWGYPTNGLPASGAGSIVIPDVSDWPEHTRFVQILASDGITERELVGGYLDGNTFVVPPFGRGIHGTTPQQTADGDRVAPVGGLNIGIDAAGVQPYPTSIQQLPIPDGSLYSTERIQFTDYGTADLPVVSGAWSRGTTPARGLAVGSVLPDYRVGIWCHLAGFPGMRRAPLVPLGLSWRFTVGGVTYTHRADAARYRIAEDLSAERYRVYHSIGEDVPVDTSQPIAVGASRPLLGVGPLVDGAVNNLELHKINDFGIEGLIGRTVVSLEAGGLIAPIAPNGLRAMQTGATEITLIAYYFAEMDADPADTWDVLIATGANVMSDSVSIRGDRLLKAYTSAPWATAGRIVQIAVRTRRSSDGAASDYVTAIVTTQETSVDAPSRADLFHGPRRPAQEETL